MKLRVIAAIACLSTIALAGCSSQEDPAPSEEPSSPAATTTVTSTPTGTPTPSRSIAANFDKMNYPDIETLRETYVSAGGQCNMDEEIIRREGTHEFVACVEDKVVFSFHPDFMSVATSREEARGDGRYTLNGYNWLIYTLEEDLITAVQPEIGGDLNPPLEDFGTSPSSTPSTSSSASPSPTERDRATIPPGTFKVGESVDPGTYYSEPEGGEATFSNCYWETLDPAGNIIANNFISSGFRAEMTISGGEFSFSSRGCGTWHLMQ